MKISELIQKLETLKSKHGDNELHFTAQDGYSRYQDINLNLDLRVGDTNGMPSDWFGSYTIDGKTRIEFYVKDNNGKIPKMTYR